MIQEVVAVIDRSGSMAGKESDTIGGINATIDELKQNKVDENGNSTSIVKFSIKFFDHQEKLMINSLDIENITPLKVSDLKPRGQTALLDAMGNTITHFINKKKCDPSSFDTCIIYVATDGIENCSIEYTKEEIKNLVEEAKQYSIEILYLGANQDSILEANQLGLDATQALNYSETTESVESAYRSAARAAKRYRTGEDISFLDFERQESYVN
jgi:uncharacterized protein YegL